MAIGKTNCGGRRFPNGTEWTATNVVDGSGGYISFGDGTWVASDSARSIAWYSTNGKNWTQALLPEGAYGFSKVHYSDNLWVAGSSDGLLYSEDNGRSWSFCDAENSSIIYDIYRANGVWVAATWTGIYVSPDGKSWTKRREIFGNNRVAYSDGLWVASTDEGLIYSTDNGANWTQSNINSGGFLCVCKAKGIWVAGSGTVYATVGTGAGIYYSIDGKTWNRSNLTEGEFEAIEYANGIWVAGGSRVPIYYSIDGVTWNQSNLTTAVCRTIQYSCGIWIACLNANPYWYACSKDGLEWEFQTQEDLGLGYSLVNEKGIWVMGTTNGIFYSVTWEDD